MVESKTKITYFRVKWENVAASHYQNVGEIKKNFPPNLFVKWIAEQTG